MFKSKAPIGLDISSTTLTAVAAKRRGKVYSVDRAVTGPVPPGAVVDGEVQDVEALGDAIKALWESENIDSPLVNIGLANQRCITRTIELPKIKQKKQLDQAVQFEAQDLLPIDLADAVWDYHVIEEFHDKDTESDKFRIILVMAYRESVEKFVEAVQHAGVKVVTVDLAAFALMRAGLKPFDRPDPMKGGGTELFGITVGGSKKKDDEPDEDAEPVEEHVSVLCNIGPNSTNMVVARDGVCELTRIVTAGTDVFTQALQDHFGWERADCERVRMEAGVLPFGGQESPDDPYTAAREVMQYAADQLAHEIKTSVDYYQHQSQRRVDELIISGEGTLLRGIEQRFADQLGMPVTVLDATARVDVASLERAVGTSHAHLGMAIGLALEDAA